MDKMGKVKIDYKDIPSVDNIIYRFKDDLNSAPYLLYLKTIRSVLNTVREEIKNKKQISNVAEYTYTKVFEAIKSISEFNLRKVINGTGIILHTGLGRAPISKKLLDRALKQIVPYSNLELNLETGKRGERNNYVQSLLTALTGSESSLVVNNNAAAVLLMLNSISEGKEVIISRGQQVEIGGSFRIPDVICKSGCIMVEVGTTNKTHLKDYENAINSNTGAILVAHTSNYKIMGFTESVELNDLHLLAKKTKIPLILDSGCGVISDLIKLNLPYEPTVLSYIKSGADIVSFSGDKLLGGPQAGIICGKKKIIKKIQNNPLYRALRSDKFTYAILEAILRTYISPNNIKKNNLSLSLFQRNQDELMIVGNKLLKQLPDKKIKQYKIEVKPTQVEAGSGSMPLEMLPSVAIEFKGILKASELSKKFRLSKIPILGYIKGNKFYIDLKAISPNQETELLTTLKSVL